MSENAINKAAFGYSKKQSINISGETKKKRVKKILILSASPINLNRMRFDEEIRKIEEVLQRAKYRDCFEIKARPAVRYQDLRHILLDIEPHILHFIGHGNMDGLKLEDQHGHEMCITTEALTGLFALFSNQIECVVFSSCYSALQANKVNQYIHYVIGMLDKIMDKAAIAFAVGFYEALGAGQFIEKAFACGCNAIQQVYPHFPAHLIPILQTKQK